METLIKQKFQKGDHVRVAKDLGSMMSHFPSDCEAIVIGSYYDQYGGNEGNKKQYTIHLKGGGQTSWYYEHQLILIKAESLDLLKQWEKERDDDIKEKSDLDWIFSHGEECLKNPHGSTASALAKYLGVDNLWGSHGEGAVFYSNCYKVLAFAHDFLIKGDKDGYIKACEEWKAKNI